MGARSPGHSSLSRAKNGTPRRAPGEESFLAATKLARATVLHMKAHGEFGSTKYKLPGTVVSGTGMYIWAGHAHWARSLAKFTSHTPRANKKTRRLPTFHDATRNQHLIAGM